MYMIIMFKKVSFWFVFFLCGNNKWKMWGMFAWSFFCFDGLKSNRWKDCCFKIVVFVAFFVSWLYFSHFTFWKIKSTKLECGCLAKWRSCVFAKLFFQKQMACDVNWIWKRKCLFLLFVCCQAPVHCQAQVQN